MTVNGRYPALPMFQTVGLFPLPVAIGVARFGSQPTSLGWRLLYLFGEEEFLLAGLFVRGRLMHEGTAVYNL
jgi:hypothetical protein